MTHLPVFREVRDSCPNTAAPPAWTTEISKFARPGALCEIEEVAALPARASAHAPFNVRK